MRGGELEGNEREKGPQATDRTTGGLSFSLERVPLLAIVSRPPPQPLAGMYTHTPELGTKKTGEISPVRPFCAFAL